MRYVIHALDHADGLERRLANYEAHKTYLSGPLPVTILVSGPILASDGETMAGSLFIVEAPDRAAVDAFHANDPFKHANIWRQIDINPVVLRQVNL